MKRPLANAFPTSWFGELGEPLGLRRRGDDEVDREAAAARQRRRHERDDADARDLRELPTPPRPGAAASLFFRSLQGFVTMPPKPPVGDVIWKMLSVSGNDW